MAYRVGEAAEILGISAQGVRFLSTSFTSMGSQVRVLLRPPHHNPNLDTRLGL